MLKITTPSDEADKTDEVEPIDADLDLLESYLDDELLPAQRRGVEARLASDPAFAARRDELLGHRVARREAYDAAGFDDAAVIDRLIASVRTLDAGESHPMRISPERSTPFWRTASAAAAALLVGVLLGSGFTSDRGAASSAGIFGLPPSGQSPTITPQPVSVPASSEAQALEPHFVIVLDAQGRLVQRHPFATLDAARAHAAGLQQAVRAEASAHRVFIISPPF